jgi:hypothetical protein
MDTWDTILQPDKWIHEIPYYNHAKDNIINHSTTTLKARWSGNQRQQSTWVFTLQPEYRLELLSLAIKDIILEVHHFENKVKWSAFKNKFQSNNGNFQN